MLFFHFGSSFSAYPEHMPTLSTPAFPTRPPHILLFRSFPLGVAGVLSVGNSDREDTQVTHHKEYALLRHALLHATSERA